MRLIFAMLIALSFIPAFTVTDAAAQATCRNKCNNDEQACLARTNNKSQCGNKAKTCLAKCK